MTKFYLTMENSFCKCETAHIDYPIAGEAMAAFSNNFK
jgi:hypothetical protein